MTAALLVLHARRQPASCEKIFLSVNYLPSKFSSGILSPGARRRKHGVDLSIPKRGGGREVFKTNEPRMPDDGDEDFDGNNFKWTFFMANVFLSVYALTGLISCLLTWFDVFEHADIVRVGSRTEFILSTIAAAAATITSVFGWAGILLNNRSFLAYYTFFLWICFGLLVAPGYLTCKQRTFNLEGKINAQWSRNPDAAGRLHIQNHLHCCGYYSPFVEATTHTQNLVHDVFSLVPFHIMIILAGLLCSNHVTYRFGKGMMPKAYRLSLNSMAIIMDHYASQLAEQYGSDVASDILARSRSNIGLESLPYAPQTASVSSGGGGGSAYNAFRKA
ncbi:hypothetical protein F5141DRAFT_1189894 [Pisolithus sp. B1]|nr:hypothetical protein F5141DRAFT_1189894 [Pisolithus sp. B1]